MTPSALSKEPMDDKKLDYEDPVTVLPVNSGKLGDEDRDAEFGGWEERRKIERKLLWKLDCRMSIMIIIYILNYVSILLFLKTALYAHPYTDR